MNRGGVDDIAGDGSTSADLNDEAPLPERLAADARTRDVFNANILPRLDSGDLAVLATVNRKMRDVVFDSPVDHDVRDVAAVRRELGRMPNFVGSVSRLAWAKERGCPWDENTCAKAAEGGHLEVLQWARANGCPWNKDPCAYAAAGGHLEVLQWARANGCPWDEWTCTNAAEGGHLEVLQWARANGCPSGRPN